MIDYGILLLMECRRPRNLLKARCSQMRGMTGLCFNAAQAFDDERPSQETGQGASKEGRRETCCKTEVTCQSPKAAGSLGHW
jgi:hypothetical protein